jgi:hypothetical protein
MRRDRLPATAARLSPLAMHDHDQQGNERRQSVELQCNAITDVSEPRWWMRCRSRTHTSTW